MAYERIEEVLSQMAEAARESDWERMHRLEAQCTAEVQKLRTHPSAPLVGVELQRKISSIHKILAHDKEIRDVLNPWMHRMDALLAGKTKPKPYEFLKPPPAV